MQNNPKLPAKNVFQIRDLIKLVSLERALKMMKNHINIVHVEQVCQYFRSGLRMTDNSIVQRSFAV